MGVCTSSGKGAQSVARKTTRSLTSSWNLFRQRANAGRLSTADMSSMNSVGGELLKRAVGSSARSASYKKRGEGYDVNLGTNNPSYRLRSNTVSVTSGRGGKRTSVKEFANPAEAVKFVDRQIKRIRGNRK